MKEFIIADANRNDISILGANCSLDVDIGNENDFQLVVPLNEYNPEIHKEGNILYCIDTEYGGILNDPTFNTSDGTVTFTGDTPRGLLNKKIIEPPAGYDYRYIETFIPNVMQQLLDIYDVGSMFVNVAEIFTTRMVKYKFDRYCKLHDGVNKLLNEYDYKLNIRAKYDANNKVVWQIETVPAVDYTEELEYSQDCNINFKIKQKTNLYTHMICAGQGDLKDRTIVHLYLQQNGSIGETQYYTGADDKVYFYDYSSAESEEELKKSGKNKFAEINKSDVQEINFDNLEMFPVQIGDKVGGRDYNTGIAISQKVTNIIYKYQYGTESIEVKIGE